jgi:hypothetical protein
MFQLHPVDIKSVETSLHRRSTPKLAYVNDRPRQQNLGTIGFCERWLCRVSDDQKKHHFDFQSFSVIAKNTLSSAKPTK